MITLINVCVCVSVCMVCSAPSCSLFPCCSSLRFDLWPDHLTLSALTTPWLSSSEIDYVRACVCVHMCSCLPDAQMCALNEKAWWKHLFVSSWCGAPQWFPPIIDLFAETLNLHGENILYHRSSIVFFPVSLPPLQRTQGTASQHRQTHFPIIKPGGNWADKSHLTLTWAINNDILAGSY